MTEPRSRLCFVDDLMMGVGYLPCRRALPEAGVGPAELATDQVVPSGLGADDAIRPGAPGLVIEVRRGWPGRGHLRLAEKALRAGIPCWLHWPQENIAERITPHNIARFRRDWLAVKLFDLQKRVRGKAWAPPASVRDIAPGALSAAVASDIDTRAMERELVGLITGARPVPLVLADGAPTPERKLDGAGLYLRTDFWSEIASGGSYGHSCYVAEELARRTRSFACHMANRFALLDELGVEQHVLGRASPTANDGDVLLGTEFYYRKLGDPVRAHRPAYIYERMVLGNYAAARLSRELAIPYIAEYNGSEISLKRSFDGRGYEYEDLFRLAEQAAFAQATVVVCVSQIVADGVIARGIDPARVMVNPNGGSPRDYRRPDDAERRALRAGFGWSDEHCVVGFIGSFGGWHGIEVLAAGIPAICAAAGEVRFLLIGDGNFRHLVDDAVARHGLADRVRITGAVPQAEGRQLLGACDIYVSPHSRDMVDSRFFGSPTKLFEYMAMGGAIVASDLEQIGEVLRPALRPGDLSDGRAVAVGDARAVLCRPGDVAEFADAVAGLARRPEVRAAIGRNARDALVADYSWERNVERLWAFIARQELPASPGAAVAPAASCDRRKGGGLAGDGALGTALAEADPAAPWLAPLIDFTAWRGKRVLVAGAGSPDLPVRLAVAGAEVTVFTFSAQAAERMLPGFLAFGLKPALITGAPESIPVSDGAFDGVFAIGSLTRAADFERAAAELVRVLAAGGALFGIAHAERSLTYWRDAVLWHGLRRNLIAGSSVRAILSRMAGIAAEAEGEQDGAAPVNVFSEAALQSLFGNLGALDISRPVLGTAQVPGLLSVLPAGLMRRLLGWTFCIRARKEP